MTRDATPKIFYRFDWTFSSVAQLSSCFVELELRLFTYIEKSENQQRNQKKIYIQKL